MGMVMAVCGDPYEGVWLDQPTLEAMLDALELKAMIARRGERERT